MNTSALILAGKVLSWVSLAFAAWAFVAGLRLNLRRNADPVVRMTTVEANLGDRWILMIIMPTLYLIGFWGQT